MKKNIDLSNLIFFCIWKNIKSSDNNNKFKISVATWDSTFELPDGSYPISDIQNNFDYFIKKHGIITDNPLIIIYVNKRKN